MVRSTPLTQTLDGVMNDPWNKRLGLEFLRRTPDLRIGPFEGFSVPRKMPSGALLTGFGRVNSPVATRMAWLGRGNTSVELTGMARLDQPLVQDAIDAMVDSLSCLLPGTADSMTLSTQRYLAQPAGTRSWLSPVHPTPYLTLPKRGAESPWLDGRILEVCGETLSE